MRIVFATGNKDKMKEIRRILGDLDAEILSMKEAGVFEDVVEDGTTFSENAAIKASAIYKLLEEKDPEAAKETVVLADDSGLEVDFLGGEPGIYSARYLGKDTPYTEKNRIIIERLKDAEGEERSARFVCAIAACLPGGKMLGTLGKMEGRIGYEIAGENGFGYDPIFFLPEYGKTSAEISADEKNAISHRGKALREMEKLLREAFEDGNK
ncbi:MAG: RdgB/HAM1 family non-canonical purine NTP pyrophosphatase [Butyrivibrio sp.]|uniref:RdgB/HAM1 family non-canonical purine NTP pyrophosphatase n=1 Tax=Butyrivibrio sp. TaxID=28121 RepID=UPI001B494AB4|nr:RdgB/HAM1 family non-canonical purine NTP pyrophosphatase [Butyrivibrio sp.]MBP3273790.1 RdgB/HAM1 family non-canonical purine NTP pyrophosphatase [Butyrivibrio sp.]MBP3277721.1 RdgB/HAM1 family non-canonical purine NTP pyrophosphatase [Butyrivibrio sp.]MBP3784524.1 RdgB/HAM1 family non-canonical purine NTP pyrophosphatase [Butyrivibrio sp.]